MGTRCNSSRIEVSDLVAIFYELLLEDIQKQIDHYGGYQEYLLATQ